ncbi:hypothetical protein [Roseiflexus sp.]|uniref:hypothetical protein n=1 Tax=Roseiflexus sp. TaxID=2562120 RepID=UPI00398B1686
MTTHVTLTCVHHDPESRLRDQSERVAPELRRIFSTIVVRVTDATPDDALTPLVRSGAAIHRAPSCGHLRLGRARREALRLGIETGAHHVLFCDLDRVLHWAEYYAAELTSVAGLIPAYDFLILGRTQRAFESHPRAQCDTEAIVNRVFARVSGQEWDVTAAARGVSRRAAATILDGCPDETIGTDVSWPLFLQRTGLYAIGAIATEGLEYETADRFPEDVAAAGGIDAWKARIDANPREWSMRLEIARLEVEAAAAYAPTDAP